jgi:hydrogenase maturation protease
MGAWYRMNNKVPRVLIIGYGNPLCGDDGVGWLVASSVEETIKRKSLCDQVEIITSHQLLPEHAEDISRYDLVIFVDACCDKKTGVVSCRQIEAAQTTETDSMNHQMDPAALLAYAKTLYDASPDALLYTIGGSAFDFGESMTRPVKHSARFVIESIIETADRICSAGDRASLC